jgi:hypothetical protein
MVVCTYNPRYAGDHRRENCGPRPAPGKIFKKHETLSKKVTEAKTELGVWLKW